MRRTLLGELIVSVSMLQSQEVNSGIYKIANIKSVLFFVLVYFQLIVLAQNLCVCVIHNWDHFVPKYLEQNPLMPQHSIWA